MTEITDDERIAALVREEVQRQRAKDQAVLHDLPAPGDHHVALVERQAAALRARQEAAERDEAARLERVEMLRPKARRAAKDLANAEAAYQAAEDAAAKAARHALELYDVRLRLAGRVACLEFGDDV